MIMMDNRVNRVSTLFFLVSFVLLGSVSPTDVYGQAEEATRRRNFNVENGVALREFDPVSYFDGRPLKGTSAHYYTHKGITYYFANAANRDKFAKAPDKYEPVYGGWCAYTVATTGERVKINPSTYKIIDGKLHLFYNFNGDNRLRRWNADEQKLRAAGNRNWTSRMH
jgi:YHS domain-containing protein